MDNFENYLYAVFAVIYIISRILKARKKQNKQPVPLPQTKRSVHNPTQVKKAVAPKKQKSFTFEDILKEFEKNLTGEEEFAHEKPLPVKEIRHERPAPVVKVPETRKPNQYESYQASEPKSIKEEIEASTSSDFSRSENYAMKNNVASEYVKMLQDPQGFKNAIVLSEIINRKYF